MYEVGEYIVHPGQGVCKVDGITEGDSPNYLLMPVGSRHPMRISFPVASEGRLRRVLTSEEARSIIAEYPTMEPEGFTDRSNALEEEHFKNEIRRGSCRDTVRVAKTFRHRIAQVRANNRKPPVSYERIYKQASERSLEELAVALGTSQEDVASMFQALEGEDVRAN